MVVLGLVVYKYWDVMTTNIYIWCYSYDNNANDSKGDEVEAVMEMVIYEDKK